jgi:hypothetical protein
LFTRVTDAYPFHPDLRELVGKFKENEGFQQTRGVIRLMQMVVANLWNSEQGRGIDLIHPYDLDLNLDEIASEVRTINPSLSEAIAHDIAHAGDAEVEQIDAANGNSDASDAARLILVASLSTTPGAIHGLREYQLVDCLQRPGRDLSTFKANVLDKLATRAWYLHNPPTAACTSRTSRTLPPSCAPRRSRCMPKPWTGCCASIWNPTFPHRCATVTRSSRFCRHRMRFRSSRKRPRSSSCVPAARRTSCRSRPTGRLGGRSSNTRTASSSSLARAIPSRRCSIPPGRPAPCKASRRTPRSENTPSDDPQWRALDALRDRVGLQFTAALKEAFDQIVYPSINAALRATGTDLAFAGNQNGEATLRHTLEGAQKFTTKIDDDSFRTRAEARLFGSAETKVVLWSDFKRAPPSTPTGRCTNSRRSMTSKPSACAVDLWREEGNHIRRGPFPTARA